MTDPRYFRAKNAEGIFVSEEEFLQLAVESGLSEEKAKEALMICRQFGSEAMLGDQMVGLKAT